jgi:hypothetical protein
MFKKLVASAVAIMMIASSSAMVYAGPEDEQNGSTSLIKLEQPIENNEEKTTKSTGEDVEIEKYESWIHIVSPKIDPKDNTLYNDGELVLSVDIDSDEDIIFMLTKVKDNLASEENSEELSEIDKFIVYSLAINKKIKADETDTDNTAENNGDAQSETPAIEENPDVTDEEKEAKSELPVFSLVHTETMVPDDIIGVNPIPLKDVTPGDYKLLFFKKSFYDEIVEMGKDDSGDKVISIDQKDKRFEAIELTIKPSAKVLEETIDSNSVTDILLGE